MVKQISGSIRPRPNAENVQYYNLTLELGTDPATGKRKRLYFKINTTDKQEAENELMIKKSGVLTGENCRTVKRDGRAIPGKIS